MSDDVPPCVPIVCPAGSYTGSEFRVVVWDVAESSFVRQPDLFRRVLGTSGGDIFILNGVGGATREGELRSALRGLRDPSDTAWHVAFGRSGGARRVVIASRHPVAPLPEFAHVAYPEDGVARVLTLAPDSLHARLRAELGRGVAANAVEVYHNNCRPMILAGADLWAGGAWNGWQEARRQVEAGAVHRALRAAAERRGPDAMVLGADLSITGGRAALDSLHAPFGSWRHTLALAPTVHRDGWADWTWDGRGTPYHTKRLDVVLYNDRVLRVVRGIVIDTAELTPKELFFYGLEPGSAARLSRHRPVLVELDWLRLSCR